MACSRQAEIKEMKAAFDLIDFDGPAFNSGSEGRMDSDECGVWRCWEVWNPL